MKKIFLFILSLSFLICSCNNSGDITGSTGGGNGNTDTDKPGGPGGENKPSWFLTPEQQKLPYEQRRITLWTVNQNGAKFYRIPAIAIADDNTIIAAADKRWNNINDLPNKIDVVIKTSKDGGKTWSSEKIIGKPSTSASDGHGDPFIIKCLNGDLIIGAVAGPGFWNASYENPGLIVISRSTDNGNTWSDWEDITSQIYGKNSSNPLTTQENKRVLKGFGGSGAGLTLKYGSHKGRIMFAMYVITKINGTDKDTGLVVYSDDNGRTWKTSEIVNDDSNNFNEPKVMELVDGRIMYNTRPKWADRRRIGYSQNSGETFPPPFKQHDDLYDPGNNADMARLSAIKDGDDKNRILFINTDSKSARQNLTIKVSYDEGDTWKVKKVINPGASSYGAIAVAPDGTILTFAEERFNDLGSGGWHLVFRRFNLNWLTSGQDSYAPVAK